MLTAIATTGYMQKLLQEHLTRKALPLLILLSCSLLSSSLLAEIKPETLGVETLDEFPSHGVLVNSMFSNAAELYNADTGEMLGQLSLGYWTNAVEIDKRNKLFHVAETYMSRGTRGIRTEVVTSYEFRTLSAVNEVIIPNKRASGSPHSSYTGLTDDARFMMVSNITPAMSISVVDLRNSKLTTEIATAGCGLVYPVSNRSFLQLCGDGAVQLVTLNNSGKEKSRIRSERFFDVNKDPLMEKAIRTGKGWVFPSFAGDLYRVSVDGQSIAVDKLFNVDLNNEGWRIGGVQSMAYHAHSDVLLTLMHEGGEDTHKDPGTEIWFFNLASGKRLHRMKLEEIASSITVSQDDQPLIYTAFVGDTNLDIYNMKTGKKIRRIENIATTPAIIQNLQL